MRDTAIAIIKEVKKAVIGKDDVITKAFMAMLSQGHILLEDIPVWARRLSLLPFPKPHSFPGNGPNSRRIPFLPI